MKKILAAPRWAFIAMYTYGLIVFIFYLIEARGSRTCSANWMLMASSHFLLLGAMGLSRGVMRDRYIWRTFAIYIGIIASMIYLCPPVMGMVGSYAAYVVIGYLHTKVITLHPYLEALEPGLSLKEKKSDKYALWAAISVVSLILFYWQCNLV